MPIIFEQLAILFMFLAVGYLLARKGLVKHEHSKVLSTLGMYLFSPAW